MLETNTTHRQYRYLCTQSKANDEQEVAHEEAHKINWLNVRMLLNPTTPRIRHTQSETETEKEREKER